MSEPKTVEVHFEALPVNELSRRLEETIVTRHATCVVLYPYKTNHGAYQVFYEGTEQGYCPTEADAYALIQRLAGGDLRWVSDNEW